MTDLQLWTIFLQRRRAALKYFRPIPNEKIWLNTFLIIKETGHRTRITQSGWRHYCTSVGCVAGWLWTMPEYLAYCRRKGIKKPESDFQLEKFLGIDGWHEHYFAGRLTNQPEKREAINRLKQMVSFATIKVNKLKNKLYHK